MFCLDDTACRNGYCATYLDEIAVYLNISQFIPRLSQSIPAMKCTYTVFFLAKYSTSTFNKLEFVKGRFMINLKPNWTL